MRWLALKETPVVKNTGGKNWLLYLDESRSEITIGVGDTLTLRPYGEWHWKNDDQPASLKSKVWQFDDGSWNTGTQQTKTMTDNNKNYSVTYYESANAKNGTMNFRGYDKWDDQLHEYYTVYHGTAQKTGTFTLKNSAGKTITVHVVDYTSNKPPIVTKTANNINDYSYDKSNSGILNRSLITQGADKGYPKLSYGNGGASLRYLFDTGNTSWGTFDPNTKVWSSGNDMIAYPDVEGLFQQDNQGYYYFNSNSNYAYYNGTKVILYDHTYTQNTKNTSQANAKPIGFFPFHDYDSVNDLYVNQNSNLNHHIGMSMTVDFEIPSSGKNNGNDIVFEFSGDDDMQNVKITNSAGVELPSIGGPGTSLIYLLGILLTVSAGAGLMMRKRHKML